MSDSQRLISRYVMRLYPAVATYYRLHFLRTEKDDSAIHMLKEALATTYQETSNPILKELLEEIPKDPKYNKVKFGQHFTKKKKKSINADYDDEDDDVETPTSRSQLPADDTQRANQLLHTLSLEDALQIFEKIRLSNKRSMARADNKFYRERIEINLVLENYREALLIAQKAVNSSRADNSYNVMAFVSAIASGEFYTAKEYFKPVITEIKTNPQDGQSVASIYELIHLVIFVCFATCSAKETLEKSKDIFDSNNHNYDIQELKLTSKLFYESKFSDFLKYLHYLENSFHISIYTFPVKEKFIEAIIQNVTVLYLYPLARASFQSISDALGLSNEQIIFYVKKSIREGKLDGKLDLVSMQYVASVVYDNSHREMVQILNDSISIRHNFETNIWTHEYNTSKAPHGKK